MSEEAEGATLATRTRPRPDEVVARDNQVHAWLATQVDETGQPVGRSRTDIATAVGLEPKAVYLSLWRLKRDGRIVGGGGGGQRVWSAVPSPV